MTDGRVDFHGIDAEGAVAIDRDHLAPRQRERCRDGEWHANAEAAEGAGVHIGCRAQAGAGEAEQVAAVGDGDVIGLRQLGDHVENCAWMNLAVLAVSGRCLLAEAATRSRWRRRRPSAQVLSMLDSRLPATSSIAA